MIDSQKHEKKDKLYFKDKYLYTDVDVLNKLYWSEIKLTYL